MDLSQNRLPSDSLRSHSHIVHFQDSADKPIQDWINSVQLGDAIYSVQNGRYEVSSVESVEYIDDVNDVIYFQIETLKRENDLLMKKLTDQMLSLDQASPRVSDIPWLVTRVKVELSPSITTKNLHT